MRDTAVVAVVVVGIGVDAVDAGFQFDWVGDGLHYIQTALEVAAVGIPVFLVVWIPVDLLEERVGMKSMHHSHQLYEH